MIIEKKDKKKERKSKNKSNRNGTLPFIFAISTSI
jgi:hypothetical protein